MTLSYVLHLVAWYALAVGFITAALLLVGRYMDRQAADYWADPYTTDELESLYRMPAARR